MNEFEEIVLSGGGKKGIAELGVLHYYYEKKLFIPDKVKVYRGTSIGSIISLLLIYGYSPMQIFQEIYKSESFFKLSSIKNITQLFSKFGLTNLSSLLKKVVELLKCKNKMIPTLLELFNNTGKILIITASNMDKMTCEFFSHDTQPNMSIIDAIEISCNLPLIFQKIKYNNNYYIDGGILNHFPIDPNSNKKTLGILIVGYDYESKDDTLINYIYKLVIMPINMIVNLQLKNISENTTLIVLKLPGTSLLDINTVGDQKMNLFLMGYSIAKLEDNKEELHIAN